MNHLLILASQFSHHPAVTQSESNLQRQLGVHMTPNQGTGFIVVVLVLLLVVGVRRLGRR